MWVLQLQVVLFGTIVGAAGNGKAITQDLSFPPGFKFGVASSAYQVEGAWNVSDKSESIWDRHTHSHPEYIKDHDTGDVACDSYHHWRKDVEMLSELGVHFYRFSISWSRLLPHGIASRISADGHKYYSDLIDGLLEKGIEPIITIYHFDLPQRLQDLGGWTNPLISEWFADYARVVFSLYGDRVKTWITINEPIIMCDHVYNLGTPAPGILDQDIAPYLCNKHALIAHAKAYRIYDEEFRKKLKYDGQVGLANQLMWADPLQEEDEELTELVRLNMARSCHAVFSKEGGWPSAIEKIIAESSRIMGYPFNRLPSFSHAEIELIKGTSDFYALNYYTSRLVRKAHPGEKFRPWPVDCRELDAIIEYHPTWRTGAAPWLYVYPEGLRKQLAWLKEQYGDHNFMIMENGYASTKGLNDAERVNYHREHLKQVLLAIKEDKVNVTAYTVWSLMDSFEWLDGYNVQFGLYEVDASPERRRTPRASARFYASVVAAHSLDVPDVTFEDLVDIRKSNWTESLNTWQAWLSIFAVVSITVAVAVAVAAFTRGRRTSTATDTQRPSYVTVHTDEH